MQFELAWAWQLGEGEGNNEQGPANRQRPGPSALGWFRRERGAVMRRILVKANRLARPLCAPFYCSSGVSVELHRWRSEGAISVRCQHSASPVAIGCWPRARVFSRAASSITATGLGAETVPTFSFHLIDAFACPCKPPFGCIYPGLGILKPSASREAFSISTSRAPWPSLQLNSR